MQNIKYHIINTGSVIIFSYILAITISQFIRLSITPVYNQSIDKTKFIAPQTIKKSYDDYKAILDSTFFKLAGEINSPDESEESAIYNSSDLGDLYLLGTISGPASVARALIKKKGERESEIFKLWNDVYGYKLVRIDNSKVYLKKDDKIDILDMYAKREEEKSSRITDDKSQPGTSAKITQSISRSEIQQKVLNNIDNALKGLVAGPYRDPVNGNIEGYKLKRVSPSNILYKLGARSGDIVRRVNGHTVDSTEKLLGLWESVQGESKITVDIERGGKLQTFDLNITD